VTPRASILALADGRTAAGRALLDALRGLPLDGLELVAVEAGGGLGRRDALAAAAASASADVCIAVSPIARPTVEALEALADAVRRGAPLAGPVVLATAGPVHGYRRERDGSLWPRRTIDDGPLDALSLECVAALRSFLATALPPFAVDDGPYELAVAAAAGGVELVPEAGVRRTSSGPAATVAVCTRDRAGEIGPCVDLLAAHGALEDGCEILVVDNGSADDTASVVRERAARHGAAVRLVVEPEPGLSNARNAALREARCEAVLFLDDDARPAPGWLESMRDVFADPGAAVAGGPIHALWPERPAERPDADLLPYLSVLSHGDADLTFERGDFYGANWACRRELALRAGGFDPRFGVGSANRLPGEEIALAVRIAEAGLGTQRWAAAAAVGHRVDPARLDPAWLLLRGYAQGRLAPWARAGYGDPEPAALPGLVAEAARQLLAIAPLRGGLDVDDALDEILRSPRSLHHRVCAASCLGTVVACAGLAGATACDLAGLRLAIEPRHVAGEVARPGTVRRARLDAREHVVVAFGEELLADRRLLSGYVAAIGDAEPVTLAVVADEATARALAAAVGDVDADLLVVPEPHDAVRRAALAARASAVYGAAERPEWGRLPRYDHRTLAELRECLGLEREPCLRA